MKTVTKNSPRNFTVDNFFQWPMVWLMDTSIFNLLTLEYAYFGMSFLSFITTLSGWRIVISSAHLAVYMHFLPAMREGGFTIAEEVSVFDGLLMLIILLTCIGVYLCGGLVNIAGRTLETQHRRNLVYAKRDLLNMIQLWSAKTLWMAYPGLMLGCIFAGVLLLS